MIPGVLLFLLVPLLVAPVVYFLRRFTPALAALVAGGTMVALGVIALTFPLDGPATLGQLTIDLGAPWNVFERTMQIGRVDQPVLAFLCFLAAALFGFGWRVNPGPHFYSVGLAFTSVLAGIVVLQAFQYAALLWVVAGALAAFLIQGGRPGSTQAAQRHLMIAVIGLPPILVAGWELDKFVNTPDETSLLAIAAVLFACTFAVFLSVVPFHGWVPAVGAEAPPLVAAWLFTAGQTVMIVWLLSLLGERPQLLRYVDFYGLLKFGGLSMTIVGGVLAFSRGSFGRLMGYGALIDMGAALLALGQGDVAGLQATLMILVLRGFGLTLAAAGLSVLRERVGSDTFERVRGHGWDLPLATAALLIGGLSLAGFPLTPGFVGRWALLRLLARGDAGIMTVVFLAGVSVAIGYMRGLGALLAPPSVVEAGPVVPPVGRVRPAWWPRMPEIPFLARFKVRWPFDESPITAVMLIIAILVCLGVATAPQLILPWVGQVALLGG